MISLAKHQAKDARNIGKHSGAYGWPLKLVSIFIECPGYCRYSPCQCIATATQWRQLLGHKHQNTPTVRLHRDYAGSQYIRKVKV